MTKRILISALAAAAVAASGAPAADAAVGSMSATLKVSKNYQRYSVDVRGVVKMTQTEAQNMINQGYRVKWSMWGSDPVWDDHLFGPDPASLTASSRGLEFHGVRVTTGSSLDEDDSWTDERDELYASVGLTKPNGASVRSAKSGEFWGYF
ncbi:MAG TPA: hypothetical protein VFZ89_09455 [Solirubrobacteraceae bacterium]